MTKSYKLKAKSCGIVSLITVFAVGLLALGAMLAVTVGTLSELNKNKNAASGDQTFYAAESGVFEGTNRYLAATTTYSGGSAPLVNNTATNSITLIKNWPVDWPYVFVRAVAENQRNRRIILRKITHFLEGEGFSHALFVNGDLDFGGSGEINGSVFSNNDIDIGGSAELNGDAYAANNITISGMGAAINGNQFEGVSPLPVPVVDTLPYEQAASSSIPITWFNDDVNAENYLHNHTRNAIIFVDDTDEVKLGNNITNLTGSLLTKGDLVLTGGDYSAATITEVVLWVGGDLDIAGGVTINGFVLVEGQTAFNGDNTVTGAIISKGGISVPSGNTTINFDPVLATAWPDLLGLSTSSAADPTILNWSEE